MDHSIGLLSAARFAEVRQDEMRDLLREHPKVAEALWWSTLVDEAVLREWLVNVGQRSAYERMAHLFIELFYRLEVVGLAVGMAFTLPVTQEQLADTLGLTPVHINRTLQRMREEGLIELENRRLRILDMGRLCNIAAFDDKYLHRERRS